MNGTKTARTRGSFLSCNRSPGLPLRSTRAFYEDVRSEIQSVVAKEEEMLQHTGLATDAFIPAYRVLEKVLECEDNKYRHSIGAHLDDAAEDFKILGTTGDSDPSLLQWAYECQVRADPARQQLYLQALEKPVQIGHGLPQDRSFRNISPQRSFRSRFPPHQPAL